MRDFKFIESERPTMVNFNQRFQSIADLANGLGNEYVWLRNDGTYVNSPDQAAYPPSVSDGYTYTLLGQLANLGVKIATGNYSGAGFGGPSSPNTLTFDFEPQILLIATKDGSAVRYFIASRNSELSFFVSLHDGSTAKCSYSSIITWNGKTVSWYCTADRSCQMNYEGLTYNYIAIG